MHSIPFCKTGDDYTIPWQSGGFSRCLVDIVGSLSSSYCLFIVGLSSIVFCGTQVKKPKHSLPWHYFLRSPVLCIELVASAIYCVSFVVDFILNGVLAGGAINGSLVLVDTVSILAWGFSLLVIIRERMSIFYSLPHSFSLVVFWVMSALWLCCSVVSLHSPLWWWGAKTSLDIAQIAVFGVRSALLVLLVLFGVLRPLCSKQSKYRLLFNADEVDPVSIQSEHQKHDRAKAGSFNRKSSEGSTFGNIFKKCKLLFPYIWPRGHPILQLRVAVCFLLLVSGRVINLYVPMYYKKIVNALTPNSSVEQLDFMVGITLPETGITFPLVSIILYVFLKFLQGGSVGSTGFVNNLRSLLWINVQQYTSRAIQLELFGHLHSLSLRWHLGRKTGEVLRVMDRGTQSINNLLSYVLFSILPTIADIIVAIVYFIIAFDVWFGLIVFTAMMLYLLFTIAITEWRTKYRRIMNEKDNEARAKAVDSLINFETVKYYGQEEYEVERLRTAIMNYQDAEWESIATLNILNFGQNVIISAGLLCGCLLCGYRVTQGVLNVGDFVLFATYVVQLYVPLNFFGTYYRLIQQSFIDMENMFDLLAVTQEVRDIPNALPLNVTRGKIEFRNVYFHYTPEKPILRNVSFSVGSGETIALVGPSGAGKSTIIRLLFRFYNIQDGIILIDGQDISQVGQSSVRRSIGVVPQDTVLFNDNIKYNIRYGRVDASEAEVERAASHADIHNKILTFPTQYNTVVGERGLKLSGGEKQRVAIARTILKDPAIILLDEATSALDTQTERNIQSSLMRVCEERTTIIVAHRLSTVIHADQILVLKDGEICEQGAHHELLELGGVYASMWYQQQRSLQEEDMESSLAKENNETKL